jgi:type VI protein secretion system component VasF
MPTAKASEYRDALHSYALPRMRHRGSSRYRWWLLFAAGVALTVVALWVFWR